MAVLKLNYESYKEWFEKTTTQPVRIAFWAFILSVFIVTGLTLLLKLYDPEFAKNVLVEAHGMLFDILVIGLFILWLNEKGRRQLEIQRYKDEIDDFRGWKSDEAAHRIRGNIIRLNKCGVTKIDLRRCYLKLARLPEINLKKANLDQADLENVNLRHAELENADFGFAVLRNARLTDANLQNAIFQCAHLEDADFMDANLENANLDGAYLMKTVLQNANLQNADLGGAHMQEANLYGANLQNANLYAANLRGINGLYVEQLCKTKTLYKSELDNHLMSQIKEKCPNLLEKPEDFKEPKHRGAPIVW